MRWLKRLFKRDPERAPAPVRARSRDLPGDVARAQQMLATLVDAYGDDSPLVRQQRGYLEFIQRELSTSAGSAA